MDTVASELAEYLLERLNNIPPSTRLCIGISGTPATGKTTLSALIAHHVNYKDPGVSDTSREQKELAIVIPLDGWHLPRRVLDTFPNPKLAHDRRGSHWTFDGSGYVSFVEQLRRPITEDGVVTAPSFSHSLKDPVFDDVIVRPHHRIVIIEGLYVFLGTDPWVKAARTLDERWFLTADAEQRLQRLCKRHVETGVTADWEEAVWRAENNDIPNGIFVETNMLTPTKRIFSIEDPSLSTMKQ